MVEKTRGAVARGGLCVVLVVNKIMVEWADTHLWISAVSMRIASTLVTEGVSNEYSASSVNCFGISPRSELGR